MSYSRHILRYTRANVATKKMWLLLFACLLYVEPTSTNIDCSKCKGTPTHSQRSKILLTIDSVFITR
jgi:hypothetical protein